MALRLHSLRAMVRGRRPQRSDDAGDRERDLEAEVAGLGALLAGLGRLHAAPHREGVLAAVEAIVHDVLGSGEVVVYERSADALVAARARGVGAAALKTVPLPVGGAATLAWVRERPATPADPPHTMSACVPLVASGAVVGAVVVYRVEDARASFRRQDRAALEALGSHAGAALRRVALEAAAARR